MEKLTGSEKQIKWAEDIRFNIFSMFEREYGKTPPEHIKNFLEALKSETSAAVWIDMRDEDVTKIFDRYINQDKTDIENRINRIVAELAAHGGYTDSERTQIINKICTDGLADQPDYLSCIINFACRKLDIAAKYHTRRELPAWNQRRAEKSAEYGFAIVDYKNQR
jgi:hypothetical protein